MCVYVCVCVCVSVCACTSHDFVPIILSTVLAHSFILCLEHPHCVNMSICYTMYMYIHVHHTMGPCLLLTDDGLLTRLAGLGPNTSHCNP